MINTKRTICAAGLLLLSTGLAAAVPARVATDLNVRAGEGSGHPVIAVMPAGAIVDVTDCADGWCFVRDYGGFASAAYLDFPGVGYSAPPPVYVAPPAAVIVPGPVYRAPRYRAGRRIIRRGIREFRRELRRDRREDRREARQERREDRRGWRERRR